MTSGEETYWKGSNAPPSATSDSSGVGPPSVLFWFRLFCGSLALLYALFFLFGLIMAAVPSLAQRLQDSTTPGAEMATFVNVAMGLLYAGSGLLFFLLYAAGAVAPQRPWFWIVGLLLIAFSFTSCCCLPVGIPLLIAWIKDETRNWFAAGGRPAVSEPAPFDPGTAA